VDAAAKPPRMLVVGYGNTLRGDDGAGPRVAELLAADPRLAGVEIMQRHQLTPELAADFVGASLVVLIDARETGERGEITIRRLDGDAEHHTGAVAPAEGRSTASGSATASAWTHHVDAASLVALARELWGATPAVYVVGIGVQSMELGDDLSGAVKRALPSAADAVAAIVARHRPG
jgi:hydrogenase maturation protease